MTKVEKFRQHLLNLQKRGSTEATVDIATLLELLSEISSNSTVAKHKKSTSKSLWVDGGDFSDDGG